MKYGCHPEPTGEGSSVWMLEPTIGTPRIPRYARDDPDLDLSSMRGYLLSTSLSPRTRAMTATDGRDADVDRQADLRVMPPEVVMAARFISDTG